MTISIGVSLLMTSLIPAVYAMQFYESGAIATTTITYMKVTTGSSNAHVGDTITTIVGERARPFTGWGSEGNPETIYQSVLVGKSVNEITLRLSKVGTPTGTATIGVFDVNGAVKFTFGTLSVSTLTTTPTDKIFTAGSFYTIAANDRIGIQYTAGTASSYVVVGLSDNEHAFDWQSSLVSTYVTPIFDWGTSNDLIMTLRHVETTVQMNVATGANFNTLYGSYPIIAEAIKSGSALTSKPFDQVTLTLAKVGTPTGTATIGVFDSSGNAKFTFGTKDVSTLTTTSTSYVFKSTNAYRVVAGDYVGIKYTGGTSTAYVKVTQSNAEAFDGNNSALSWFVGSSNAWCDCYGDLKMKLELTEAHFYGNEFYTGTSPGQVWVALSSSEIGWYTENNAATFVRYPVSATPTFLALDGTSLGFTETNAGRIGVLNVNNGAQVQDVNLAAQAPGQTWNPYDITTFYDTPGSNIVAFTSLGTPNWGEVQMNTGQLITNGIAPTLTGLLTPQLKGIAATLNVSQCTGGGSVSNKIYLADTVNKLIWVYDRLTHTYSHVDLGSNISSDAFLTVDHTNCNLWGTDPLGNKVFAMSEVSLTTPQSYSADYAPFNYGAQGPERIRLASTDLLLTYDNDFIGAFHNVNYLSDQGHRPIRYGTQPFDIVNDPNLSPEGNPGWQATYSGSNIVVRGTHFPI